jgi:hypothetical protein
LAANSPRHRHPLPTPPPRVWRPSRSPRRELTNLPVAPTNARPI